MYFFIVHFIVKRNSVDPEQTPSSVASDLGLHCLPRSHLSHVMRKPVYAICEQQRRRSA